jgi:uncharacterized delta-60 repeat protein
LTRALGARTLSAMRRKSWTTIAAALACLLALSAPAHADFGDLDPAFGEGGVSNAAACDHDWPAVSVSAQNMAVQPDGKIVFVGLRRNQPENRVCVSRLTPSGTLDGSFGTGGHVVIPDEGIVPSDVAVAPDGRIVVVTNGPVYRFEPDGDLDPTFDGDGRAEATASASGVAIQPDGRILIASDWRTAVVRLTTAGALDTTFAGDGVAQQDFPDDEDRATAVALHGDKIVLSAAVQDPDDVFLRRFGAVRFHADGSPDASFGDAGRAAAPVAGWGGANDVTVTPAGLVLTGTAGHHEDSRTAVARLTHDGNVDTGFSGDGVEVIGLGGVYSLGYAAGLMADGGLMIGGSSVDDPNTAREKLAVARLTPSGALDSAFGAGGIREYPEARFTGRAVFPRPDGSVLVGGGQAFGFMGAARIAAAPQAEEAQAPADQSDPPRLSVTGGSAVEGGVVPFTITLDRPTTAPVSVDFVTGDESAERGADYHARRGTLTIPVGETSATVLVSTVLDRQFETDEELRLELSNPQGATLDRHIDTATIVNFLRTGRCANDVIGRGRGDTLSGTPAGDRMRGRVGDDVLFGLSGDDCIYGEKGPDLLFGGDGDDVLEGDSGDDQIKGENGDDRLVGGRGINRYNGGPGDDRIYSRNGRAEIVECGPGNDWVKADRIDRLRRCERRAR